jgi:general secretion pathway protein D
LAPTAATLTARPTAKQILEGAGIPFPEGASASFVAATSTLVVKNTQPNLDSIEAFVEGLIKKIPQQIYITTKFVEVNQENRDELGFDWLLGQFSIGGPAKVFGGGGTNGTTATPVAPQDFPFLLPGTQTPLGGNPVTSGLRSGTSAIASDSIQGLINSSAGGSGATVSKAPGVFAISGVFTDPQFQLVIRALAQKKGTDLMSAPSVTTRSGQRASVEVVREFRYPTEFNPPQIPTNFGTGINLNGGAGGGSAGAFPVTPTNPTAFEMRPVGVRMEVDPVLGPDGYTIDLNLSPEVTEFDGFINYGSPIQSIGTNALGQPIPIILTDNRIVQPVFETRKVTTAVTIWDGQTVVLGGLIREDVQDVEDKVPILGDLPWIGRLFQSKSEDHLKKNLMIFVTAKLIDPSGTEIRKFGKKEPELPPATTTVSATGGAGVLPPPVPGK